MDVNTHDTLFWQQHNERPPLQWKARRKSEYIFDLRVDADKEVMQDDGTIVWEYVPSPLENLRKTVEEIRNTPSPLWTWMQQNAEKEGDIVEIECDCGRELDAVVKGEECQMLEWACPECGYMTDVND